MSPAPQPLLILAPSGADPDRVDVAPRRSNAPGASVGVGAVGAVDDDAQRAQVGAEALEHVVDVAPARALGDLAGGRRELSAPDLLAEQRLDAQLLLVAELAAAGAGRT